MLHMSELMRRASWSPCQCRSALSCTELLAPLAQVTDSNGRIILFIDEIHTVVGAGASEGSMDAGTTLDPVATAEPLKTSA